MTRTGWKGLIGSATLSLTAASFTAATPKARAGGESTPAAVREWVRAHEVGILREFTELLAIPNLARDEPNIRRNAEHVVALLGRRGLAARLLDGDGGPPAVYGERTTPGAKRTIVIYAHYDGQPVTESEWATPPWTPTLRDGRVETGGRVIPLAGLASPLNGEWFLYGRSTGDDKAPILAVLAALDALKSIGKAPSVNLKVFFEGEEEAGSPHLRAVLEKNKELLKADAWLLCDGPVHQSRRPLVFFGVRGIAGVELTLYGPSRALHSGHYGNWAPNPAVELAHLVDGLRDTDGRIRIAGFYDDVRPPTEAERDALRDFPHVDAELRQELALHATEAEGARLVERLMLPALNIRGLQSGAVGEQAANAIPTTAQASIDFRLVPDQTPERVEERFEAHLRSRGYTVIHEAPTLDERRSQSRLVLLQWQPGYPSARTGLDSPFARALVTLVAEASGTNVVRLPTLGGSMPMHLFPEVLGSPAMGLPIANHDDNQHAANENLRLQNLWDGTVIFATVLGGLGGGVAVTVHVGILGGGGISDTHARAASAIPGVEVVAVHGDNADKARRLAAAHHVPDYPTVEAFLAHRPMEVVAIGSPSGCHSAQAIACARAGLHVLVEKPMAVTAEDAATLVDACDASGVRLGVFFQDRLQPDLVRLKAFLDAGGLGRILLVAGHVKWYRPPEYYKASRWRGTWALDGGGAVMNQGIHTLDLMLHLLGDVVTVSARAGALRHEIEVEDTAVATLTFRSGALGTFEATTAAYPGYKRRLEISGERGTIVVEHDRVVAADLMPGAPPFAASPAAATGESAASHVVSDATPHRRIFEDFLRALREGTRPICDGREGRRSIDLVLALYGAARTGSAVTV